MKTKKYKRETMFMETGAAIEFVPNDAGGLKNAYLRVEDAQGNYVGSIDGKVLLKILYRIIGDMLTAFPARKPRSK